MEDYNGEIYEGWIQNSITDNFAIRFAMKDRKSDGFNNNTYAVPGSGSTPNAPTTDERIWRLSAKWEASEKTMVNIKYLESDYVRLGGQETMHQFRQPGLDPAGIPASNAAMYAIMGIAFPTFVPNQTDAFQDAKSLGGNLLDGSGGYGGPNERDAGTNTKNEELSVRIEHEFDSGITMNYVYGDSFYGYKDGIDADFLPVQFIGRSDDSTYNQESHELRFNGSIGDNVDWIGGFNFVDSEQKIDRLVVVDGTLGFPGIMSAVTSGGLNAVPGLSCLLTSIDPTFTGGDPLVGNCGVIPGTLWCPRIGSCWRYGCGNGCTVKQSGCDPHLPSCVWCQPRIIG